MRKQFRNFLFLSFSIIIHFILYISLYLYQFFSFPVQNMYIGTMPYSSGPYSSGNKVQIYLQDSVSHSVHSPLYNQKQFSKKIIGKQSHKDKQLSQEKTTNAIPNHSIQNYTIHSNSIEYPEMAVDMGMQGTVVLRVEINANGKAKDIQLISSSEFSILDKEAMASVSHWSFPNKKAWQMVRIEFVIDGE